MTNHLLSAEPLWRNSAAQMQKRFCSATAVAIFLVTLGACSKSNSNGGYDRLCASYCNAANGERRGVETALHAVDADLDAVAKLDPKNDVDMKRAGEQAQAGCVDIHEQLALARGEVLAMRDTRAMIDDRAGNEATLAQDFATTARDMPPCATVSPAQLAAYRSRIAQVEKSFADEFHDDPKCSASCIASAGQKLGS